MIDSMYTVGELAAKMRVSVRTLQYYDRQGLLKPSAHSEGGRRLYDSQDVVRLQHILSLKFIGLSLDEIKQQLTSRADTPNARDIINRQIVLVESQITRLQEALKTLKFVSRKLEETNETDFAMVADAIFSLRTLEERDWLALDEFDKKLKSHIESRTDRDELFTLRLAQQFEAVSNRMYDLAQTGADPAGPEGQAAAQEHWALIEDFTSGDMSLLPRLVEFNEDKDAWPEEMRVRQEAIDDFMGRALDSFLESRSIDPEEGRAEA